MLSLEMGLVYFGCPFLVDNRGNRVYPRTGIGNRGRAYLSRHRIPVGRRGIFNHSEPGFASPFCEKHPVCSQTGGHFVYSGGVCSRENKKSFKKSKKRLSKMDGMV